MDPEAKKLLEDTFALAQENNNMLHKIRSAQKWANFTRIAYWIVILGISIGAFYFLQPYVEQMQGIMKSAGATFDQIKNIKPR